MRYEARDLPANQASLAPRTIIDGGLLSVSSSFFLYIFFSSSFFVDGYCLSLNKNGKRVKPNLIQGRGAPTPSPSISPSRGRSMECLENRP